jgi:hypothetical protein
LRNWVCIILLLVGALSASARTWRVEKGSSGDFTVIQDALDAASPGDSVLVGPGRFEDFRLHTFQTGGQAMIVLSIETLDLTVLGTGKSLTFIGPTAHVTEVDGFNPGALLIEEAGAKSTVGRFTFENVEYPVTIRERGTLFDSHVNTTGIQFGLQITQGDSVVIRDSEFTNGNAILTGSPLVTGLQIRGCHFDGPQSDDFAIAIGNGATDALLANCTITGYGAGLGTSLGSTAVAESCHFAGMEVGALDVSSGSITLRHCQIDGGMRYTMSAGQGRLEVYDSVIGGGTNATLPTTTDVIIRDSHLLNGGGLTVDFRGPASAVVDVRSNGSVPTVVEKGVGVVSG